MIEPDTFGVVDQDDSRSMTQHARRRQDQAAGQRDPATELLVSPRDRPTPGVGRLRIAQVAPPMEAVPPHGYGGIERVVAELATELKRRGHEVTVFASGDSTVSVPLVPTVPRALRPAGLDNQASGQVLATISQVLRRADDFDLIHDHLEWAGVILARACATPTLTTFHGRLDRPFAREILKDAPPGLVAISQNQANMHPDVPWTAVVHNGLSLDQAPTARRRDDALCFVGRICVEKGVVDAIDVARRTGRRLRIAAKVGPTPDEQAYAESVFHPAMATADTEFLGELSSMERDQLIASSHALLMPGAWPEPFGLVAIEALACGTPVIARRVGALPEVIEDGVDGFFADDAEQMAFLVDRVDELDRRAIRARVRDRFSTERMADGYEAAYARLLGAPVGHPSPDDAAAATEGSVPKALARAE